MGDVNTAEQPTVVEQATTEQTQQETSMEELLGFSGQTAKDTAIPEKPAGETVSNDTTTTKADTTQTAVNDAITEPPVKPKLKIKQNGQWVEVEAEALDLAGEEINPNELAKGYMRQSAWTKKTQKLKQVLNEVNAQKVDTSYASQILLDKATINRLYEEAVNDVKKEVADFDAYDPKIQVLVNERYLVKASKAKQQMVVDSVLADNMNRLKQQDGANFAIIDNYAEQILDEEYPAAIKEAVLAAARNGNVQPINEIYALARERLYSQQAQQNPFTSGYANVPNPFETQPQNPFLADSTTTATQKNPPVVEHAGKQEFEQQTEPKQTSILELLGMG